ncbi:hypothetical protein [Methylobacterium goesingense]|uniref:Uncharacterized protein n=1 Tax=Methylobacterium goesingense TaxID=243690 RepID=A0ABV2L8D5_9HYPH|nr:hypothetical protein [Methylobacterium goesingense]
MTPDSRLEQSFSHLSVELLHRIAGVLDVPIENFNTHRAARVLYTDNNDQSWHLARNGCGGIIVRHISGVGCDRCVADRTVLDFLLVEKDTPQGVVVATLIDQLLVAHLADGITSLPHAASNLPDGG